MKKFRKNGWGSARTGQEGGKARNLLLQIGTREKKRAT